MLKNIMKFIGKRKRERERERTARTGLILKKKICP
jgi:hypothetical protein